MQTSLDSDPHSREALAGIGVGLCCLNLILGQEGGEVVRERTEEGSLWKMRMRSGKRIPISLFFLFFLVFCLFDGMRSMSVRAGGEEVG